MFSVIENGKTEYLYGYKAASHEVAFSLVQCINEQTDPDEQLGTAERMAAYYLDHDEYVEVVDRVRAKVLLDEFGSNADTAMQVEIDIDNGMLRIEHNAKCYKDQPHDFSISIEDGLTCYIAAEQDVESGAVEYGVGVGQRLDELLEESLNSFMPEYETKKHQAVFVFTGPGEPRFYKTEYAGTYNGAATLLKDMMAAKNSLGEAFNAGDFAEGLLCDHRYGEDLNSEAGFILSSITADEAGSQLLYNEQVSLEVTFDFSHNMLTFRRYPVDAQEDFSVTFTDALQYLSWAEADMYAHYNAAAYMDKILGTYLSDYIPHRDMGMEMNM